MAFPWFFSGFFVALVCLEKQCLGVFRGFFVVFAWLSRGFFVAPVLGKIYAYSPWKSLLASDSQRRSGCFARIDSQRNPKDPGVLKIVRGLNLLRVVN